MTRFVLGFAALAIVANATTASAALAPAPVAKMIPVTDTYFGTTIVDPYRWMETTPQSPDFLAFMKANSDRTRAALDALPGRAKLAARIGELADTAVS